MLANLPMCLYISPMGKLAGIFADLSHISTVLLIQKDAKELRIHLPSPEMEPPLGWNMAANINMGTQTLNPM